MFWVSVYYSNMNFTGLWTKPLLANLWTYSTEVALLMVKFAMSRPYYLLDRALNYLISHQIVIFDGFEFWHELLKINDLNSNFWSSKIPTPTPTHIYLVNWCLKNKCKHYYNFTSINITAQIWFESYYDVIFYI